MFHKALEGLQMQTIASHETITPLAAANATDFVTSLSSSSQYLLSSNRKSESMQLFPRIRDCNAALAAFGDSGDLLRALRLYFKMRKASMLHQRHKQSTASNLLLPMIVPTPTLVTYSTIMSRAISLGKPKVALRVWKIMRSQLEFFTSAQARQQLDKDEDGQQINDVIVPDVKAANILMNCHAKLGDIDAAEDLMRQMLSAQGGSDVPCMQPNLVTFNTLLDACHKTGELDRALYWKDKLEDASRGNRYLQPDARTYTSLIATVARKAGQTSSGAHDPSLAFRLIKEMKDRHGLQPNGMTYSALIDVCGRCHRSDLALQALRLMLDDQKKQSQQTRSKKTSLDTSAVGAWTSTINACGKAGRIDTAMKLFFESMPKFGVQPNTVTCGCLIDSLLRHGRTTETLKVLKYMKSNDIPFNEIMYTSLMTYASRLSGMEKSKAVHIYSEVMATVIRNTKVSNAFGSRKSGLHNEQLFQVSLVFQEMKASGIQPDLATYNVLLRSIANAGDVSRALEVLKEIQDTEDLEPSGQTWSEIIQTAGKAKRSDIVLSTWKEMLAGLENSQSRSVLPGTQQAKTTPIHRKTNLRTSVLQSLLKSLLICAWDLRESDIHSSFNLYKLVIKCYEGIVNRSDYLGMNYLSPEEVMENPHVMALFVQGIVNMESLLRSYKQGHDEEPTKRLLECTRLRRLGISMVTKPSLDLFSLPHALKKNQHLVRALKTCNDWKEDVVL
jgi:pentatricopeptide repeat protein